MIKITLKQLKTLNACESGLVWFKKQRNKTLKAIIHKCVKDNHFDYAKWLLCRLLTKEHNQLWAISSAESALNIFESRYPSDKRPRKAIQAAKDYLAGKITAYAAYAANAAADAANAAANDAYAAYAAAYAAYAADAAADAANAAYAAAYAAYAADAAADAANAAANVVARKAKQLEICEVALKLLGEIK